ncbi:MAG: formylglycine-generating enzyme family protein [bacterium]|nr:formylglycine-generating enzyme family protein [bacterium]
MKRTDTRRLSWTLTLVALVASSCGGADSPPATTLAAATTVATTTTAPSTTAAATTTSTSTTTTTTTTEAPVPSGFVCATAGEKPAIDPGASPGEERVDAFGVAQVWVPAGSFTMGTADVDELDPPGWAIRELKGEQPAHPVTITAGFWIDKYEVTVGSYAEFDAAGAYDDPSCWSADGWDWRQGRGDRVRSDCAVNGDSDPKACVTWYEAEAYAIWRGGTLPTEAQWEYAARGPASLIYPWGNQWDPAKANVVDAAGALPVGSFPDGASWVGALDMSGNLMEWVADWLSFEYYAESPVEDPTGPAEGRLKVEKGGWWGNVPYVARSAYRHFEDPPKYEDHHIGFRIVSLEA